jgi:uncharacterized membrane protein YkoI
MRPAVRFAFAAAAALAVGAVWADEPVRVEHGHAEAAQAEHGRGERAHACLDQKERRAEIESGHIVHLGAAMRVAKSRMPGAVVRARLCRGKDGLVYVLTVLARDGKVARLTVDAVKGTLIGGL